MDPREPIYSEEQAIHDLMSKIKEIKKDFLITGKDIEKVLPEKK